MPRLILGDSLQVMKTLKENSVSAVVSDPPYGLKLKGWDHSVPHKGFWKEALRVARPGAALMSFSGSRTFHRLACEIEDAGWELKDTLMWLYGSGNLKSMDMSKKIDAAYHQPRVKVGSYKATNGKDKHDSVVGGSFANKARRALSDVPVSIPATLPAKRWNGWTTTNLRPCWEPIIFAVKPIEGDYVKNAIKWGVGGVNTLGTRIGEDELKKMTKTGEGAYADPLRAARAFKTLSVSGRFPTNVIPSHDADCVQVEKELWACVPECPVRLIDEQSGRMGRGEDSREVCRAFFCPKPTRQEKTAGLTGKNTHISVKPLALMRWLCRLTCPPGKTILDPFMGSGSTGVAAVMEGMNFIGIEMEAAQLSTARQRVEFALKQGLTA